MDNDHPVAMVKQQLEHHLESMLEQDKQHEMMVSETNRNTPQQ